MATATYRKSESVESCRLHKDDLARLVRLATEHAKDRPWTIRISATIGDAEIEAQTLDDFLAHEDLPPILDNLYIAGGAIEDRISVSLGKIYPSFDVAGTTEVWVRGNYDRLRAFFVQYRRRKAPQFFRSPLLVSLASGAAITLVVQLLVQQQLLYGFIASVAGSFLMMRYITWAYFSFSWSIQIVLANRRSFWANVFTYNNLAMLVAIVSLIFTIIQTFK